MSLFQASICFEHMCSKHVEAWNKLIVKQTFCALSWLIIEINIMRCTVSKTSKKKFGVCPWISSQSDNFHYTNLWINNCIFSEQNQLQEMIFDLTLSLPFSELQTGPLSWEKAVFTKLLHRLTKMSKEHNHYKHTYALNIIFFFFLYFFLPFMMKLSDSKSFRV